MATNAVVLVESPDQLERALKTMKRYLGVSGWGVALRRHQEYAKPSVRRKRKQLRARARLRKQIARTKGGVEFR